MCSAVFANSLPGHIPVSLDAVIKGNVNRCGLPPSSRIVVAKKIKFHRPYTAENSGLEIYQASEGATNHATGEILNPNLKASVYVASKFRRPTIEIDSGYTLSIHSCDLDSDGFAILVNPQDPNERTIVDGWLFFKNLSQPLTVKQFNQRVADYFQIIYDDPNPYPGIDQDSITKIVMGKITNALAKKDYAAALPHFDYMDKSKGDLPESFHYYFIETLEQTGDKQKARERATAYLQKFGKKGRYYDKVLEIMTRL